VQARLDLRDRSAGTSSARETSASHDPVPISTTSRRAGALPAHLLDHLGVVRGPELRRRHEEGDPVLVEHVLELVGAVAGLMLTRIAPIRAVAYCVRVHSAQLGAQIPTRSPVATPAASRPRASSVTRSENSR
jgi:hypothetical protein